MAAVDIESVIKRGVERALNEPIMNGKSVMQWAEIGIHSQEQPAKDTNVPSEWIRVEERLPETRHAVLVYTPYHKNIWAASMHEDGNWYIWSPGGKVLLDPDWNGPITHWMPLPEPPEVKQDG